MLKSIKWKKVIATILLSGVMALLCYFFRDPESFSNREYIKHRKNVLELKKLEQDSL